LLQPLPILETWTSKSNIEFITAFRAAARDGYNCTITIVDPLTKRVQWKADREIYLTEEVFA